MSDVPNLERWLHVPFPIELELGRIALDLESILSLREGDVLRTDQPAGVPVRLLAGGVEVALANLITVDNQVAARIIRIAEKEKRGS